MRLRDPKSITTQFQYDLLGRMTVVTDSITGTTRYAFSAAGQVITITDALTHNTTLDLPPAQPADHRHRPLQRRGRL